MSGTRMFERYIGIDYSGAETAECNLKGLSVFVAEGDSEPMEIPPPQPQPRAGSSYTSPRKYWSRRDIAHWLAVRLAGDKPAIVGIDHAFSFPLKYFQQHQLPLDWDCFLMDFQYHWPTDAPCTYVDFVRDGYRGSGAARSGSSRWRRIAEVRSRGAKSVFHFDCPGSVAKSTHSGLPWLLHLRRELADRIHFWPFNGWQPPPGKSVLTEIYPALWSKNHPTNGRDSHQHDAWVVAAWMQQADRDGSLARFFHPTLNEKEQTIATIEGWILGIM